MGNAEYMGTSSEEVKLLGGHKETFES